MVDAVELSRSYGSYLALDRVSLHLDAGEVVGFLGPNGAGKSTTMNILTGFLAPSGGRVTIAGHDLVEATLACRQQMGYLPQRPPLYPDMTVSAYLDHVARLKGLEAAVRRREIVDAIEACALHEVAKRHIRKLSGGNQQRVGLAQALLGRPPILILDEPTAGLDPYQVGRLRDLLRQLAAQHSILLSTHILSEVEACCSRVVLVDRGRVILTEDIEALRERTRQLSQVALRLRDPAQLDALHAALSADAAVERCQRNGEFLAVTAPLQHRSALIQKAEAHGGLRECTEQRRSLEDVFAELISSG